LIDIFNFALPFDRLPEKLHEARLSDLRATCPTPEKLWEFCRPLLNMIAKAEVEYNTHGGYG